MTRAAAAVDGTSIRLLLVVTASAGLAAVDLNSKLVLETPPWAYHERSLPWVALCLVVLLGVALLALVPSRVVAVAAGITGGGVLGNLLSARWNENNVANPFLLGSRTDDWIAFNVADVLVLVGVLVLMPALMRVAIRHRHRLRPPSAFERRLERWLGL
ncbi:MAG: signal peptidase II [Actinobacteria bacterium]|nr:signal peptidase II [Actinomycetota bacterium]